jgi:hypothetical protein
MGEMENTCKNMIGKPEGKVRRRKDGGIAETGWVVGDWIYLHQDGKQGWISLKRYQSSRLYKIEGFPC